MTISVGFAVLAAGKGTRLKLSGSKVLAPVSGRTLIDFAIDSIDQLIENKGFHSVKGIVTGFERESVEQHISSSRQGFSFAYQAEQLGTAHAVQTYLKQVPQSQNTDYTFIMCGDTPVITSEELARMWDFLSQNESCLGVCATFEAADPTGYGRIIRGGNGFKITEQKDASEQELAVTEVNSGLYLVRTEYLMKNIFNIDTNNKSGEFYLTDLFQQDQNVQAMLFEDEDLFLGVNDLYQLQKADRIIRWRKMRALREEGVRFIDLSHTYVEWDVEIEPGACIYPNVVIEGKSKIAAHAVIEAGAIIKNSSVGEATKILAYSYLEEAIVEANCSIGPFARLRPGADIGTESKIGNFVEVKKSKLHKGVKVSHLSYVGDAEIGDESNIGCGFITCNYDGANKHKTTIGAGTFIGSDCQTVAPVTIGNDCFVAAGSTVTHSLNDGDMAIARSRQMTKEGLAKRFLKKKQK